MTRDQGWQWQSCPQHNRLVLRYDGSCSSVLWTAVPVSPSPIYSSNLLKWSMISSISFLSESAHRVNRTDWVLNVEVVFGFCCKSHLVMTHSSFFFFLKLEKKIENFHIGIFASFPSFLLNPSSISLLPPPPSQIHDPSFCIITVPCVCIYIQLRRSFTALLNSICLLMRFYELVFSSAFLVTSCPGTAPTQSVIKEWIFLFSSVFWKSLCRVDGTCSLNVS